MPNARLLQSSFNSGEISNELQGRFTLPQYPNAVERLRNFIATPHGTATNRPGTEFIREVKNSLNLPRLIPFNFSSDQTFAIELGAGYFRFFTNGGVLLNGAVPYEVTNPYAQADLRGISYEGSGDVITLVHTNYPPAELKRISNLNWTYTVISFLSSTPVPTGVSAIDTQPTAGVDKSFTYAVTALNSLGYEESLSSAPTTPILNDLTITGNFNTISWNAVTGAVRYNVYKLAGGSFAFIGQTASLSFVDDNIIADATRTIPINDAIFNVVNKYPGAVGYFQQRRFFAGSNLEPANVWATQTGSDYNMGYSVPNRASDALRFRIVGKANRIQHIAAIQDLLFLTKSTEWRASASGGLAAETLDVTPQSQNGTSDTKPVSIHNYLLYEQAQGGHVRQMAYKWETQSYESKDMSLLALHLFNDKRLVDMVFSRAPYPILWCVSSDGKLLGLTYVPEEDISAWHSHDTAGFFESVCSVTEGNEDSIYVIVRRLINGIQLRYVERLHPYKKIDLASSWHVDSGIMYTGGPATVLTGLTHLEGALVSILGDGAVFPQQTVVGGSVTLSSPVSKAVVGLPITADIKTLPVQYQDPTFGQTRVKNINKLWIRVKESGQFYVGANENKLIPAKLRTFEPYGSPPALRTGEIEISISPDYNQEGSFLIRQKDPLPLTVVYIGHEVSIGG